MRVVAESFTVIPEPSTREVSLLTAGLRLTMSVEEGTTIAAALANAAKVASGQSAEVSRITVAPEKATHATSEKPNSPERPTDINEINQLERGFKRVFGG